MISIIEAMNMAAAKKLAGKVGRRAISTVSGAVKGAKLGSKIATDPFFSKEKGIKKLGSGALGATLGSIRGAYGGVYGHKPELSKYGDSIDLTPLRR
jgi:hypothetical protein